MARPMRCSNCSAHVRPVVALDIDGTLADYHGHFLWFASNYLGYMIPNGIHRYDGAQQFKRWFCETAGVPENVWYEIKLAYRQGAQKRTQPVQHYARDLVAELREANAEIWLTTTRPYLRLDGVDADTRAWLDRHNIRYDGLLYDEAKYEVLAKNLDPGRVVAILDDLPEQYDSALQHFGPDVPIMIRNKYNTGVSRPTMARNLMDAAMTIRPRVEKWYATHG